MERSKSYRERLQKIEKRYQEILRILQDPRVFQDVPRYISLNQELSRLKRGVQLKGRWDKIEKDLKEAEGLKGEGLGELVEEEMKRLKEEEETLLDEIERYFSTGEEEGNAIVEIRAGTGGEEAALFARDLFRMYSRFAERQKWKIEVMNSHPTGLGGFKEIVFAVEGRDSWKMLRYESGVHRVQRVPTTESGGRIHTSTATVAVLPEVEGKEVKVRQEDLKIETFRASGPGGQYVNVTDSAVRVLHIPTGIVVTCQDERSQYQNKAKALRVLQAKLQDMERRKQEEALAKERREQIKHGERSEKVRTYNFPQNRVTDHRINLTLHNLKEILDGNLEDLIVTLRERLEHEN